MTDTVDDDDRTPSDRRRPWRPTATWIKPWLRAEGAATFAAGLAGFLWLGLPWYAFALLLLVPDLSMIGYLRGPRVGAILYNLVHDLATGVVIAGIGLALGSVPIAAAGAILVAHSGMDRMAGYGLKLPTSFQDTHLGRIGSRSLTTAEHRGGGLLVGPSTRSSSPFVDGEEDTGSPRSVPARSPDREPVRRCAAGGSARRDSAMNKPAGYRVTNLTASPARNRRCTRRTHRIGKHPRAAQATAARPALAAFEESFSIACRKLVRPRLGRRPHTTSRAPEHVRGIVDQIHDDHVRAAVREGGWRERNLADDGRVRGSDPVGDPRAGSGATTGNEQGDGRIGRRPTCDASAPRTSSSRRTADPCSRVRALERHPFGTGDPPAGHTGSRQDQPGPQRPPSGASSPLCRGPHCPPEAVRPRLGPTTPHHKSSATRRR